MLIKFHAQLIIEADFEVDSKMYPSVDFTKEGAEEQIKKIECANMDEEIPVAILEYFAGSKVLVATRKVTDIQMIKE